MKRHVSLALAAAGAMLATAAAVPAHAHPASNSIDAHLAAAKRAAGLG
jgi:hypothetical protein